MNDRKKFIIRHGVLRIILSFYLNIKPSELEFYYGPYNKLNLFNMYWKEKIQFNLTYSNNHVFYLITRINRVGIDLEHQKNNKQMDLLIDRIFLKHKRIGSKFLNKKQRRRLFYKYWTLKESYYKAIGSGLTNVSNHIDSYLFKKVCKFKNKNSKKLFLNWSSVTFNPFTNYIASIVVESENWNLNCIRFLPEDYIYHQ